MSEAIGATGGETQMRFVKAATKMAGGLMREGVQ